MVAPLVWRAARFATTCAIGPINLVCRYAITAGSTHRAHKEKRPRSVSDLSLFLLVFLAIYNLTNFGAAGRN